MSTPTQAATGEPVTLFLRNGRQLHGTLQASTATAYDVQHSSGQVTTYPHTQVRSLIVRSQVLR